MRFQQIQQVKSRELGGKWECVATSWSTTGGPGTHVSLPQPLVGDRIFHGECGALGVVNMCSLNLVFSATYVPCVEDIFVSQNEDLP